MTKAACLIFMGCFVVVVQNAVAQTAPEQPDAEKAILHQRLTECITDLRLVSAENPAKEYVRLEQPLLDYQNPLFKAQGSGLLVLWHDAKVPVAVASFSQRHGDRIFREFSSLTKTPLLCHRDDELLWSPVTTGLSEQRVPSMTVAPRTPGMRLVQMRRIAERFTVNQGGDSRLLSQPLYRFESPEHGVIDGALFAFVVANDPDLLLIVTLKSSTGASDQAVWNYSLARMTSSPMTVFLDGQEVWATRGYWSNPRGPTDPYVEALDRMIQ